MLSDLAGPRAGTAASQSPVETTRARLILTLLLTGAVLSGTSILGVRQLLIGDLILVATLTWVGLSDRYQPSRVLGQTITIFGPMALAFFAATFAANFSDLFEPSEALLTFAKLAVYVVAASLAADVLPTISSATLTTYLRRTLLVLLVFSVGQQIGHRVGIDSWPFSTYAAGRWDRSAFPRSASLFTEPAYLSIFVVVTTFRLHAEKQLRRRDFLTAAVILGLGASLAGVGLAAIAFVLGTNRRSLLLGLLRALPWLALLVVAVAAIPATRTIAQDRIIERIAQTADGTDASGTARLFDSWSASLAVLDDRVLTGVGVGQLEPELNRLFNSPGNPDLDPRLNEAGGTWNVLANVLAETGLLGLLALGYSVRRFGIRREAAIVLVAVCFATGTLAGWLWWCSLALLAIPSQVSSEQADTTSHRPPAMT